MASAPTTNAPGTHDTRHRFRVAAVTVVLAGLATVLILRHDPLPSYQGKSVKEWFRDSLPTNSAAWAAFVPTVLPPVALRLPALPPGGTSIRVRTGPGSNMVQVFSPPVTMLLPPAPAGGRGTAAHARTLEAMQAMGPAAARYLGRVIRTTPIWERRAYLRVWSFFPVRLRQRLPSPASVAERRALAMYFLGEMGESGRVALPDLARRCDAAPGERRALLEVFKRLPSDDFLFSWLGSMDPTLDADKMLDILGVPRLRGPKSVEMLQELLACLRPEVRHRALCILGEMGESGRAALPDLARRYDAVPGERRALIEVFNRLPSEDFLFSWLRSMDPTLDADKMLEILGVPRLRGSKSVEILREIIVVPRSDTRQRALYLLERETAECAAAAIPTLLSLMTDLDPEIRYLAVRILGSLGTASAGAVPALAALASEDTNSLVRSASVRAIGRIQGTLQ